VDLVRKKLGRKGEDLAVKFLRKNGYKILARNYSCKLGEIDAVAYNDGVVCFIEIKARTASARPGADDHGGPEAGVDRSKRKKMSRAAVAYLRDKRLEDVECRFDVVSVILPAAGGKPRIEIFKDAFVPDVRYS